MRSSLPDFHAKFKDRLRTEEQGADVMIWLAIAAAATKNPSGLFFQGSHFFLEFLFQTYLFDMASLLQREFKPCTTLAWDPKGLRNGWLDNQLNFLAFPFCCIAS